MCVLFKYGVLGRKFPIFGILKGENEVRFYSYYNTSCSFIYDFDSLKRHYLELPVGFKDFNELLRQEFNKIFSNKTQVTINGNRLIKNYRNCFNVFEYNTLPKSPVKGIVNNAKPLYFSIDIDNKKRYLFYCNSINDIIVVDNTIIFRCLSGSNDIFIKCVDQKYVLDLLRKIETLKQRNVKESPYFVNEVNLNYLMNGLGRDKFNVQFDGPILNDLKMTTNPVKPIYV